MTLKEFYDKNGDLEAMLSRIPNEEKIVKYLRLFLLDDSFQNLENAMAKGECDTAFRAAHTLKGVTSNLGLMNIYNVDFPLVEALRVDNMTLAQELFPAVKDAFEKLVIDINEL